MKKTYLMIAGLVAGILVLSYFGLSVYATGKAEEALDDWLHDNKLENSMEWEEVSASPLGGSVTLKKVRLGGDDKLKLLAFDIDEIRLSELSDSWELKGARVEFSGVRPLDENNPATNGLMTMLYESGRHELEPFNMVLQGEIDNEDEQFQWLFSIDIPELFAAEGEIGLNKTRGLDQSLAGLAYSSMTLSSMNMNAMMGVREFAQRLEDVELDLLRFRFKDNGFFRRSQLIKARYRYPVLPGVVDPDEERQKQLAREQRQSIDRCTEQFRGAYPGAEDACSVIIKVLDGQETGFEITASADGRARLGDILAAKSESVRSRRALEKINLQIESL